MYYTTLDAEGQPSSASVAWTVDLSDGRPYRLLLTIIYNSATLFVDNIQLGEPRALGGVLHRCTDAEPLCDLTIGRRQSPTGGAYEFTGDIYQVNAWTSALTTYPGP